MRTIEEGGVMAWPPAVAGEHGCIRPIVFEEGMNITDILACTKHKVLTFKSKLAKFQFKDVPEWREERYFSPLLSPVKDVLEW